MRIRHSRPSDASTGRMTTRRGATIWLVCLAMAAVVLACDAGLPSQTGPVGYDCVKTIWGCTADLELNVAHKDADGKHDLPADFLGGWSDLLVVPLSCDANCRASGGDPMKTPASSPPTWR
jgi:hypothetical protein